MRNDIYLKEMGRKIKAARKAKRISLPKMSDLCKVDMSNLWFLKNGQRNPHLLTLKSIADVLNLDVKDFIYLYKTKSSIKMLLSFDLRTC